MIYRLVPPEANLLLSRRPSSLHTLPWPCPSRPFASANLFTGSESWPLIGRLRYSCGDLLREMRSCEPKPKHQVEFALASQPASAGNVDGGSFRDEKSTLESPSGSVPVAGAAGGLASHGISRANSCSRYVLRMPIYDFTGKSGEILIN